MTALRRLVLWSRNVVVAGPEPDAPTGAVLTTVTEDATRDWYDGMLRLEWENANVGDWIDSADVEQGTTPYDAVSSSGVTVGSTMDFDVLEIVQNYPAQFFISYGGTTGIVQFHSKEATDSTKRPKLIINGGTPLECTMDVWIDSSTFTSTGEDVDLWSPAILYFDQDALPGASSAVLRLTCEGRFSGNPTISVYRPNAHFVTTTSPASGPADGTASDIIRHLGGDTGNGEGEDWTTTGEDVAATYGIYTLNADNSLTCGVPEGSDTGAEQIYSIPEADRALKMFARFTMKIHDDFKPLIGGKLPGLGNTGQSKGYSDPNLAGWGARTANGTQWSCRTNRWPQIEGQPYFDTHMGWSPYAYRLNRESFNGEGPPCHAPLPIGEFFTIDQMVEMNTVSPGVLDDGHCTYWLNGVCVMDMNDIRWVDNASTETYCSEFWLNVYIGGVGYLAPFIHNITFYSVEISSKRLPFDLTAQALLDTLNGP